jgi:hypothetical protein
VTIEHPSPKGPFPMKFLRIAFGVAVFIVALFAAVTAFSGSSLPVLNASYKCVPGSLIPQLKPGQSGTLTTSYGGFTAKFQATQPATTPANASIAGMPFKGTLTMTEGGQSWTLPRPANTKDSQINEMCVIAFQREQYPSVMTEGFTGGAHCCEVPVIYLFDRVHDRYDKLVDLSPTHPKYSYLIDANEGFIPKVVGHHVLITTGDDRFSYAFGCYACSATPLVLYSVDPFRLTDVTSQHPSLVAAHARTLLASALVAVKAETSSVSTSPAPFGLLAPWVADECAIGRGARAFTRIEQLQRQGKLSNALYHQATQNHRSFVLDLLSFLLSDGYCTGQI